MNNNPSFYSIIEQLLLSGVSLALNLLFVFFADKESFGQFSVLNSYLILILGIQSALISVPLLVEFPSINKGSKNENLKAANTLLLLCAVVVGFISFIAVLLVCNSGHISLAIAFSLAAFAGMLREFTRVINIIKGENLKSLSLSILYSVLLAIACGLLVFFSKGKVTEFAVFIILAFSALIVSIPSVLSLRFSTQLAEINDVAQRIIPHAKWAFPGVVVVWLQNNAYLTFINIKFGASIAAELAAARLLIMPYMTMVSGYTRILVKKYSLALKDYSLSDVAAQSKPIILLQIMIGFSLAVLFFLLHFINESLLLIKKYPNIFYIGMFWALFSGFASARGVLSILIQSGKMFRQLFFYGLISLFVMLASFCVVYFYESPILIVLGLTLAEGALLWVLWKNGLQYEK
ncbi:MAG: hypothetical protein K2Q15_02400 [Burkholderiales bacterium]|nr:hypothetical protein [Burkholderiales bacterium]